MLTSEILRGLPGSLDWMVLFDLPALRGLVADPDVRGMFFLAGDTDLALYSHVVLTSHGPLLAPCEGSCLVPTKGGRVLSDGDGKACLHDPTRIPPRRWSAAGWPTRVTVAGTSWSTSSYSPSHLT